MTDLITAFNALYDWAIERHPPSRIIAMCEFALAKAEVAARADDRWFPVPAYIDSNGVTHGPHKIVNERGEDMDQAIESLAHAIEICEIHNSSTPGRRQPPTANANASPLVGGRAPTRSEVAER